MATISGARRPIEARSGGKIVRQRRMTPRQTPYDRPPTLTPQALPESPNWFTSATRLIATGAGKILSTVFSPEVTSSSSSESSSSGDLSSDDEVASESGQDEIFSQEAERLHEKNGTSSEMVQCFGKVPQPMEGKSETKHVIEQLLMQETFSREECDRLITIIKSRVSHSPIVEKDQDGRSSEVPNTIIGSGLYSSAVMEAKKWLEEKKLGSGSKSELDPGTCSLSPVMLPHYREGEGSPVDVAKSYMRLRPPWASPSVNNVEVHTTSPVMIDLFREETPRSIVRSFVSSSKLKRDSLTAGSWSISEEIRRVRAKASEDLLGSLPSSKIDWSPFALEHKNRPNFLPADTTEMGLETTQDGLQNEALSSTPAMLASEQNQDMEAIRSINEKQDSGSKEETALRCTPIANGFPSPGPSLSTGLDAKPDQRPSEGQLSNPVSSNPERLTTGVHGEDTCELLSEASVEVPLVNETNNVGSGSQNSSSMQYEELVQNLNTAKSKRKTGGVVDKQGGKKISRYNRRGRGRGK